MKQIVEIKGSETNMESEKKKNKEKRKKVIKLILKIKKDIINKYS